MQWLINLVIEAIGVPPCYVERPDHADHDFETGDFTQDGGWHEFDLSDIVPANASAANLHCRGTSDDISKILYVKAYDYTQTKGTCKVRPQVANQSNAKHFTIGFPVAKKVKYLTQTDAFQYLTLNVKGWWL